MTCAACGFENPSYDAEKRQALDAWARRLHQIVTGESAAEVSSYAANRSGALKEGRTATAGRGEGGTPHPAASLRPDQFRNAPLGELGQPWRHIWNASRQVSMSGACASTQA